MLTRHAVITIHRLYGGRADLQDDPTNIHRTDEGLEIGYIPQSGLYMRAF